MRNHVLAAREVAYVAHRLFLSEGKLERKKDIAITVIMPVYNGAAFLASALDSVLAQEGVDDIEVLVLDDGSKDESPEILTHYDDPRLVMIRHPNMGLAATLNKGLQLARGRYVARQDQDDLLLPGRLAKQFAFLEDHPQVAMVGTWAEIRIGDHPDGRFHRHPSANDALRLQLLFDNPFVHSSIMMRTDVARALGGYSEDKSRQPPEDYEFWSRIAHKHEVANLPEILTVYREMPSSMSRTGINPFLSKVLRLSSENLHALLGHEWSEEDCLSLACLYHFEPVAPRGLSKSEALAMTRQAIALIGGDRNQWSAEMTAEATRLERLITSRFLQSRIPAPLLKPARWLRNRLTGIRGR